MKSKSAPSESQKKALNYTLFLLSKRSYTRKQIKDKLALKKFSDKDQEFVFAQLDKWKLLDDFQFAKNYIRSKFSQKPSGRRRLFFELIKKGVDKELIEKAFDEELPQEKEQEGLEEILAKFTSKNKNLPREKFYSRAMGYLLRRGFSYEEVKKAVSDALNLKS